MLIFQVLQMLLWIFGSAAAVFAHVQLSTSLFVAVDKLNLMHLVQVGLQAAALCKSALAVVALKGSHTCVGACVSLQVKSVVEALLAECAQVALHVAVVLHVPIH